MGNLNAERDWGYAEDYVYAMWLMLQQEKPVDMVIASGEKHSVREFATKAFARAGITIVYDLFLITSSLSKAFCVGICQSCCRWEGEGVNEVGKDKATGIVRVRVNKNYFRPTEVVGLEFS